MQRPVNQCAPQIQEGFYNNTQYPINQFLNQAPYSVQCPTNPCRQYSSMRDPVIPPRQPAPCQECGALADAPCGQLNQSMAMGNYGAYSNMMGFYGNQQIPSCRVPPPIPEKETANPPNTPENSEKEPKDVTDAPPTETCGNKPVDEDKEVFILKIGKKKEGGDKNPKLELEMCTPRGKELKPIPRKETRETQYDPADAGPATKGKDNKGKGKGKGKAKGKGKGGKGKKKK